MSDRRSSHGHGTGDAATGGVSSLRFYLTIARRRRLPIAIAFTIVLAASVAYSLHKPTLYQGHAQVEISRQNLASVLTATSDPTGQASDFTQVVQTQADIARSPDVARNVAQAVPMAHLTYDGFLNTSSVSPTTNADLLNFFALNGNAQLATALANAYANAFVNFRIKLDTASLTLATTQLAKRITQFRGTNNTALVGQLVAKQQQLQELQALQTSNAFVTAQAFQSTKVSPKPTKYIGLGILAGALLAIALAAMLEALDTRIRSVEELETRLGLPLLGYIAPPPRKLQDSLLMLAEPSAPDAEAFRLLRLNLGLATLDRNIRTVMISSAVNEEGKSTTIANLAVTIALGGARVVLVDLDLRRPTVHKLFDLGPGAGIADVALGRVELSEALCQIEIPTPARPTGREQVPGHPPDLRVLRAGLAPPDPGEFVVSPSIASIIRELRADADMVLIDAPPILLVSDPIGLSQAVDGVFLVARLPVLRRPMTDQLRRALVGCRAPVLGLVLTGKAGNTRYGYAGYGYGYESVVESSNGLPDAEPAHH